MNVYGISDLHLSFGVNKPMDIFGSKWKNYEEKVKENWNSVALDDDVIIISGDISWGMTFKETVKDLKVESLDDLFDDPDPIEEPKKESKPKDEIPKQENKKIEKLSLDDIDTNDAPILPMNEDPEDEYDLQKELEAKFDELFGPIDDDN